MEANTTVHQSQNQCCDLRKTQKKINNSKIKEKMNNSKSNYKVKKNPSVSYLDDDIDNDVILRMVLPGYNWFEDQVKNNVYTAVGEKRIVPRSISKNPKLKTANYSKILSDSVIDLSVDVSGKQKSVLTKRVMNSTLMLLPNNSLPLKKRKIKDVLDDLIDLDDFEFLENSEIENKDSVSPLCQENKKVCNPPIQKVTPILNHKKPVIIRNAVEVSKEEKWKEAAFQQSAFKNNHLQKKYPVTQNGSSNVINCPNGYVYKTLDQNLPGHLMTANTSYPIQELKSKFQPPYNQTNNNCLQCNMYRYQNSEFTKHSNHDCVKPVSNFTQTPTVIPHKGYWPSNYYQSYNSCEPLVIPETGQVISRNHQPTKAFENYSGYGTSESIYQIEQMPSNYFNGNTQPYRCNGYWNKPNMNSFKQSQINPVRNEYRNSNSMDYLNTSAMYHHPHQYFYKGFNPIG